ncbi:hypothetical protein SA21202_1417 [Staphylococcus aureus subsp. aureus 21202]|nr:hypothetical protein SA21202_1417 [Staphylococcus aureus subsp. aureus 21202]
MENFDVGGRNFEFCGAIVIENFYGNVVAFKYFQNHLYSQ